MTTVEHVPASEAALDAAAAVYRRILDDPERAAAIRAHRAKTSCSASTDRTAPGTGQSGQSRTLNPIK